MPVESLCGLLSWMSCLMCACSEDYTVKPSAETNGLTASNRCRRADISRTLSAIGKDSHK